MEITQCDKFYKIDYADLQTLLADQTLILSKAPDGSFVKVIIKFESYDPTAQVQSVQQQITQLQTQATKLPTADDLNAQF